MLFGKKSNQDKTKFQQSVAQLVAMDMANALELQNIKNLGNFVDKEVALKLTVQEPDCENAVTIDYSVAGVEALSSLLKDKLEAKDIAVWKNDSINWKDGIKLIDPATAEDETNFGKIKEVVDITETSRNSTKAGKYPGSLKVIFDDDSYLTIDNQDLYVRDKEETITDTNKDYPLPKDGIEVSFKIGAGVESLNPADMKVLVKAGQQLATFPQVTVKTGYDKDNISRTGNGTNEGHIVSATNNIFTASAVNNTKDVVEQKPGTEKPAVPANYVKVEFAQGDFGTIAADATKIYWVNPEANVDLTEKAPAVTANTDYKFTGWDKALMGKFADETKITATYKKLVVTEDPKDGAYVKVSFSAEANGNFAEGTTSEFWVLRGENVTLAAPVATGNEGYAFESWAPEVKNMYDADTTHKAQYTYNGNDVVEQKPGEGRPSVPDNFVKVEFKAGEHGYIANTETTIYWVNPGKQVTLTAPKVNAETGFKHTGWDSELTSTFNAATDITAIYKEKLVTTDPNDEDYVKVNFVAEGKGSIDQGETQTYRVLKNEPVSLKGPKVTPIANYAFTGWNPEIAKSYNEEVTHKAQFTYNGGNVIAVDPDNPQEKPKGFVEVDFSAGDYGSLDGSNKYYVKKDTLVELTAPTVKAEEGYKFTGWDRNLIGRFSDDSTTITAQYKKLVVTEDPQDNDYAKVSFTTSRGSLNGTSVYWVLKNEEVSLEVPTVEGLTDYEFVAWDPAVKTNYGSDQEHKATFNYKGQDIVPQTGEEKPDVPDNFVEVKFLAGDHGSLEGTTIYWVNPAKEVTLTAPKVTPAEGYNHTGWDKSLTATFTQATEITATYEEKTPEYTNESIIPFEPTNPSNSADKDDANIPTSDKDGKPIVRNDYVVVGFIVDPDNSGTLSLGDIQNKTAISALVKKDSKWAEITLPRTTAAENYTFRYWTDANAETVADGQVRTAKFITNGQEITGEDLNKNPLPSDYFAVKLEKGTGIANDDLFGKTYAVKKDQSLAQAKFPTLEVLNGYKDPKWNVENPWGQAITKDTTFTASATSSVFDKNNIAAIEITQDPTKMTYTEGEKPVHDGIQVKLTDKNGNSVTIGKDQLEEYRVNIIPAEDTVLTVEEDNGHPFSATVAGKDKDGKPITLDAESKGKITVNEKTVTEKSEDPKVDQPVRAGDEKITGTGVAGATIVIKDKDDKEIGRTAVDKDGKWEVTIPEEKALAEGDEITVTQEEKGKNPSDPATVTVAEKDTEGPSLKELKVESDGFGYQVKISGKITDASKIVKVTIGDYEVPADKLGDLTVSIDEIIKEFNGSITIVAEDEYGNKTEETYALELAQPVSIRIEQPMPNAKFVLIRSEDGAIVNIQIVRNGNVIHKDTQTQSGDSVRFDFGFRLRKGDRVLVTASKEGNIDGNQESRVR
jgi:hypothetical protein